MAAVDPTEEPEADGEGNVPTVPRSTLRIVKRAFPELDEDDDEVDEEYMKAILGEDDSEDDEDDSEEPNGGPSDPAKAKKHRQDAAIKKLLEAAEEEDDEDEDMEDDKPNGIVKSKKGKGKALEEDDDDEDDEDDSDDDDDSAGDLENFVVCTLDTERVSVPCDSLVVPSFAHSICTALPAAPGHHCQPRREDLLRRHRQPHRLPDRQLHHGRRGR